MNKTRFLSISNSPNGGAIQIAGLYLLIGGLWILFSDQVAARIALNEQMLTMISVYKGWGYVLVTAVLLYWLIQRHTVTLRASQMQLHQVIDAMPAFISYVGADRHYRFTNKTYKELYDERPEGKHIEDVIGRAAYQRVSKYIDQVLTGESVSYETAIPYQDTELFLAVKYIPDIAADGRVKGFFVMGLDRTAQKKAEEELRLWADAFEGCYHGIAIGDPHTNRIVVCNPAFAGILKRSVDEVVGSAILSLHAPSDTEHVRRQIEKADQIGHARYEAHMTRSGKDGSVFPVQIDVVSVLDDDGELLHRVVTAQDISERKEAEESLQKNQAQVAGILNSAMDAIISTDTDQNILIFNPAAEAMFRCSQSEAIGQPLERFIPERFREAHRRHVHHFGQTGVTNRAMKGSAVVYGRRSNGDEFPSEASISQVDIAGKKIYTVILRDITERKQAEEYLHRFELLSEHSRDIILFTDRENGRILDANAAALQAYGYSREELVSLTVRDLRASDTPSLTAEQMAQADAAGILFETTHRRKDGSAFPVEVSSQGATIGGVRTLTSIVRDITERKKAEEALRLKDELLRLTSEMAKVGGWEFDTETGKGTWTDEVARIHDLDPAQETNIEIGLSYYEGESREKVEQAVKEAIEHAEPYDLELEMVTAKGNHKWARTMALPIVQDGKVVKVQGIFQDITERKQIEKALQTAHDELELKVQERTAALSESNALLQAMMDHMPDQIYFKDMQGRFIRNSRSQANLLGLNDTAQAIGKTDFDFFPHASRAYAEEQEIMRSGKPLVDLEEWVVWPDGREMWVSTTKIPLRNAEGQTIGIFGISHDITERKQTEQAIWQLNADLEKQAEQLKAANKELEAFSYSVSHDLRAPLRAIDGYTRILVEDYESILHEEGKRVCSIISKEARRMGQLIDDLLAFSRLGRKQMYASKIDMRVLAVSVLNELLKEEERARIDFHIGKLPAARGDSSLIRQVWVNLLSNAIKFTARKERAVIEVGSKTHKDEIVYYVRDSGAGFDMEYANKLFGVFQRLHSESEFDGTGVGLAIVQRIVHRHEGRVWAEGEVGKGATFYFALPRKEHHHE